MQTKIRNFPDAPISAAELRQVLDSDAGRQLLQRLQQQGGASLTKAVEAARNGDTNAAKQTIGRLLEDRQTAALLEQLRNG